MKTSSVLASLLFGSFAVAAPFDKRALVYKYETVVETVVVYTTVYGDEPTPAAPATTSSAGEFYQQPKPAATSSVVAQAVSSSAPAPAPPVASAAPASSAAPTSSAAAPAYTPAAPPAYTPAALQKPSSIYTPPVETPTSTSTPTPTPTPAPAPAPETSSVAPPPAPSSQAPSSAPAPPAYTPAPAPAYTPAPAPAPAASTSSGGYGGGSSSSELFSNVDITVYDNTGAAGACGESLTDDMMVVAIAQPAWSASGGSTYDRMTGKATNPWCGKKIEVHYGGKTVPATIMDLCPGCAGPHDIDLSHAVWSALGLTELTRLKASWNEV